MDDDEYYQKETYRIYKEEIKGIGITSLHYVLKIIKRILYMMN